MPFLGKLLAWRQVAVCALAGVVKIHWDERKEIGVVKLLIAHAKPLPQEAANPVLQNQRSLGRYKCARRGAAVIAHLSYL